MCLDTMPRACVWIQCRVVILFSGSPFDVEVVAAEHGRGGLGGPDRLVADAAAVVRGEAELKRAGRVGRVWCLCGV